MKVNLPNLPWKITFFIGSVGVLVMFIGLVSTQLQNLNHIINPLGVAWYLFFYAAGLYLALIAFSFICSAMENNQIAMVFSISTLKINL
jgi:hypothetical protein